MAQVLISICNIVDRVRYQNSLVQEENNSCLLSYTQILSYYLDRFKGGPGHPGHKTPTMAQRYAHLAPAHKVKAVDVLDAGAPA